MRTWWNKLKDSALFLYLICKHDFDRFPIDPNNPAFVENLWREAKKEEELKRFFGAYAFLVDVFRKGDSDLVCVKLPTSINRHKITTNTKSLKG